MALHILLYVPNIIGYIRLLLLGVSWVFYESQPQWSLSLYTASILLDAVDGYTARKLNQCSAFGAWFDVVIDILGRGLLWSRTYSFGYLIAALEWLTFVCTHTHGAQWKSVYVNTPWWVSSVMAKNFKTPMGVVAITGLQVLPVWLYGYYSGILDVFGLPLVLQHIGIGLLSASRALCMAVEIWCIWSHVLYLTSREANDSVGGSKTTQSSTKSKNLGQKH